MLLPVHHNEGYKADGNIQSARLICESSEEALVPSLLRTIVCLLVIHLGPALTRAIRPDEPSGVPLICSPHRCEC
jgi:hypothetical protein